MVRILLVVCVSTLMACGKADPEAISKRPADLAAISGNWYGVCEFNGPESSSRTLVVLSKEKMVLSQTIYDRSDCGGSFSQGKQFEFSVEEAQYLDKGLTLLKLKSQEKISQVVVNRVDESLIFRSLQKKSSGVSLSGIYHLRIQDALIDDQDDDNDSMAGIYGTWLGPCEDDTYYSERVVLTISDTEILLEGDYFDDPGCRGTSDRETNAILRIDLKVLDSKGQLLVEGLDGDEFFWRVIFRKKGKKLYVSVPIAEGAFNSTISNFALDKEEKKSP